MLTTVWDQIKQWFEAILTSFWRWPPCWHHIEKQKGVRFLELEPDWSVNKWSTIFKNSAITERKLVWAKDTGTVFGIVDTRFVILPIEDVSPVYILHYGVSCHIQTNFEFIETY